MSGQPLIDWGWIGGHLDDLWALTVEHLVLAFLAVFIGFGISFVLALVSIRWRVLYGPITAVAGLLYVIPSIALFAALVPITGLTSITALIALVSYTILILVRSTVTGIDGVPHRGQGGGRWPGLHRSRAAVAGRDPARAAPHRVGAAHRRRDDHRPRHGQRPHRPGRPGAAHQRGPADDASRPRSSRAPSSRWRWPWSPMSGSCCCCADSHPGPGPAGVTS